MISYHELKKIVLEFELTTKFSKETKAFLKRQIVINMSKSGNN